MRVVRRIAPALGDAKVGRRVLGFALATDEPILITEVRVDDNQFQDDARLAPGEAYMTLNGDRQIRASLVGSAHQLPQHRVRPAGPASDIGTGELLFVSDPLRAAGSARSSTSCATSSPRATSAKFRIPAAQIMVLATDGAIDILPRRTGACG